MTAYPVFEMRDGERLLTASGPLIRHVGSLIGNRVQVPHPADTSGLVRLDRLPHRPLDASVAGRFPIDDWPGDDSIGWWVEARDPSHTAVWMADALASCGGEGAFMLTTQRVAVTTAEYLFASFPRRAPDTGKKSLLGKVLATVTGPKAYPNYWDPFTGKQVAVWQTGAEQVSGVSTPLVGRAFPFPKIFQVDFADGSVLYGRYEKGCLINGVKAP
ncbi:hypothetical protein LWC34_14025 [Kibdelosporangium philippinense]|uniref:Uncharacterized protein n=1 Tax=Kibdelosporangium philippinense TaxID=211113 RepID=A0ABS8Z7T3_9PSEU|nr:hypothetical protein [Kibdelosporangium philippinense]MCE7003938.1 hypothetical protein [Kibdelosporangium philippinense]